MKVAGIAEDLTLDMFKKHGYNFVAPVMERNGKYYIQSHKDEGIYKIIEMAELIDDNMRDAWLRIFLEMQDKKGNDVGSIYNHEYEYVEYHPMFLGDDMLRKRDETFHVQPDIDLAGEKLILGISLDDEVFIGNAHFIVSQLEILIGKATTDEEFDILYRVYGMTEQFEQMGSLISEVLMSDLNLYERDKWMSLRHNYEVTMQVEDVIRDFKSKKDGKNPSLIK